MDVLIKNMELPKKGTVELTIYEDGHVLYEQDDGQYIEMGDATAIELPPHGRIGDLDKLAEEFDGHGLYLEEEVKKIIDFFPIVLEAST